MSTELWKAIALLMLLGEDENKIILTRCSLQSILGITSASIYFPYMLDFHVSSLLKNTKLSDFAI